MPAAALFGRSARWSNINHCPCCAARTGYAPRRRRREFLSATVSHVAGGERHGDQESRKKTYIITPRGVFSGRPEKTIRGGQLQHWRS